MKKIPLTQGRCALVDDDDFDRVSKYRWHAWRVPSKNKYYARRSLGKGGGKFPKQRMHRFIMEVTDPLTEVDHINGNGLDNRKENLRLSTKTQNQRNRQGPCKMNKSGYRGVGWSQLHGAWRARVTVNKRQIILGFFDSPIAAAKAFDAAAMKYYGEFAGVLNFPDEWQENQPKDSGSPVAEARA